jgi:hypothetical protein
MIMDVEAALSPSLGSGRPLSHRISHSRKTKEASKGNTCGAHSNRQIIAPNLYLNNGILANVWRLPTAVNVAFSFVMNTVI